MGNVFIRMALSSLAFAVSAAYAQAMLDHAEPRVGSIVAAPPREISLWFTQKVEPAFSKIEVTDANGDRVDEGNVHLDESNPTLLHIGLKALASGTYKVHWKVLSVDTHTTEGHFSFTVAKND